MLTGLIRACEAGLEAIEGPHSIAGVAGIMRRIAPELRALEVTQAELPWGRFLLHHDPEDRFNIQLDVFSSGYTGSIHAHETWGIFWVLKGSLWVWDYAYLEGAAQLQRHALIGPGGGQAFCPPVSDWHRVGTPADGPQTVSVHIYGAGFDMDVGLGLDELEQVRRYTRSPFKEADAVLPALRRRQAELGKGG